MKTLGLDGCKCWLCGSERHRTLFYCEDYNWGIEGMFTYLKCRNCGLVFQDVSSRIHDTVEWYPDFYGTYAGKSSGEVERRIESNANRFRSAFLEKFCRHGSLFDVGCGSGFFLEHMRRRGWRVAGVERAREHVEFARKTLGIESILLGSWPDVQVPGLEWDVVSFIHTIEHFANPLEELSAARALLRKGGLVLVETPNVESWPARIFRKWWVALDAPRHLNLFSRSTLEKYLERSGFEVIHLRTYSPSTLEYSESMRSLLRDLGVHRESWRIKENRCIESQTGSEQDEINAHPRHVSFPIRSFHICERLFYRTVNWIADGLGNGCNVLALGQKP